MDKIVVEWLSFISLLIFLSVVPILFISSYGTTFIWTILIPLMPIGLIIVGFSRWRDICPLATLSKLSQNINLFQKRKVPLWFEKNFWLFQYFLLFIALSLRLIVLNADNYLLASFFLFIILAAFSTNLIYTGKSWCNFFCPVGVVEKIYTLSNAKNYMNNSACGSCTACKKNCPDIDLESNYWKESALEQKTFIFYSFSGLILGFYLYFYLLMGNLDYYFSGLWTEEKLSLLSAGFFFFEAIPLFLAAPLTLIFFSLLTYTLFHSIEKYIWKKRD